MSHTISMEQAAADLTRLVGSLAPGDEIILTRDHQPVAKIVPTVRPRGKRRAGSCKGMLVINEEDDQHLAAFAEYMP